MSKNEKTALEKISLQDYLKVNEIKPTAANDLDWYRPDDAILSMRSPDKKTLVFECSDGDLVVLRDDDLWKITDSRYE